MTNDQGGDGGEWAASESKDWKDGRHRRDNKHVHAHAGEVSRSSTRRHLSALSAAFERSVRRGWVQFDADTPDRLEETTEYRDLMAHHATEGFSEALAEGDAAGVRHYVGSQSDEPDVSGMRTLKLLEDLIGSDAAMMYVFGHMGNGKSMFASLIAEIWAMQNPGGEVAGNTRTIPNAKSITNWSGLQDWMIEDQSTILEGNATPKLFIFDEASSKASGRGKDGYDASTKLATMCYKIRKYGGSLIVVGHDGKDVHPAVREMCVAFHKTDKKKGRFYRSVSNRKGIEPMTGELTGIPLPDKSWQPNTYDTADWSWQESEEGGVGSEESLEDMAIWTVIRCKEEGLSDRETAKYVPFGKSKVNTVWNDYNDGGRYGGVADTVEAIFA